MPRKAKKPLPKDEPPWFSEGVHFTCVPGCRRCCGGAPGDVWVSELEIQALAKLLKTDVDEFERSYVRRYPDNRASLRERANGDCVLLDDHGCSVYSARPKQCRDYPFWPEVLSSPMAWIDESRKCPGIGEGALHAAPKLIELLKTQEGGSEVL